VNVYYHYRDLNWTRENHQTFVYPTEVIHQDEIGKPTKFDEQTLNIAANYSLNEPDKYLFNVTFRNNYNNTPNSFTDRISTLYSSNDSLPASISDHSTWRNSTPSLDIYFQRNLKNNQLLIFDAVGTYMDSKSTRLFQQMQADADPYIIYSCITGNKYSLITEGIYEKRWKIGTLTAGLRHAQSYTENNYSGSATSKVGLAVAESNAYVEYKFHYKKFNYNFGTGVKRTFYSQDGSSMEKYIFRPSLGILYNINKFLYVRYNGYVDARPPSLSDMNNVTQNIDAYQIQKGNPNLQTAWFANNNFNARFDIGLVGIDFYGQYYYVHKPIMEQITLADSMFVHININQRAYHHIWAQATLKLRTWKDHIVLSVTPAFHRYILVGSEYLHTYNYWNWHATLLVSYKNWFFQGEGYTRRNDFLGETQTIGEQMINFAAGYNTRKWSLGIFLANPFTNTYSQGSVNYSALAPYSSNLYTHNFGQLIGFNATMNLNFGRKYNTANKRLDNTDTDSGIMTGTKK